MRNVFDDKTGRYGDKRKKRKIFGFLGFALQLNLEIEINGKLVEIETLKTFSTRLHGRLRGIHTCQCPEGIVVPHGLLSPETHASPHNFP